jgi:hypothetical protein
MSDLSSLSSAAASDAGEPSGVESGEPYDGSDGVESGEPYDGSDGAESGEPSDGKLGPEESPAQLPELGSGPVPSPSDAPVLSIRVAEGGRGGATSSVATSASLAVSGTQTTDEMSGRLEVGEGPGSEERRDGVEFDPDTIRNGWEDTTTRAARSTLEESSILAFGSQYNVGEAPLAEWRWRVKNFVEIRCGTWRMRCDKPLDCGIFAALAAVYAVTAGLMVWRNLLFLVWVVPETLILFILSVPDQCYSVSYFAIVYCTLLHLIPLTETFYPILAVILAGIIHCIVSDRLY